MNSDKILKIIIKAQDEASKVMDDVGGRFGKLGSMAATAVSAIAKLTAATGVALTGAMVAASKASWDQVASVEQATVGLRAYEQNADKVNGVLSDLIKYARSDMGVLFNRKDLFQSAQMLKLNGVATEDLSKNVQILSRSVGLGLGNWQDLNSVVGRVVSTGRLSGIEFDQLTQYGFKLDKSLRNVNISAEDLFKALDKGIPVNAMEGQANTIRGLGIRMQTAFRGIGDAILGVDADTSKFVEGGLGDRLTKGMSSATDMLKQAAPLIKESIATIESTIQSILPTLQQWAANTAEVGRQVAEYLGPKLQALWTTLNENLIPTLERWWKEVLVPLLPVIGTLLVVALGLAIDALNLIISAFSSLTNEILNGNPIIVGLVGLFGTLAAAMAFNAVFNALTVGFATLRLITIPSVMADVTALRTLIASPLGFGAIVVAAALMALYQVKKAAEDAHRAITNTNKALDSTENALAQARTQYQEGKITKERYNAILNNAYADGTDYHPGGLALVGERGPEIVDLPRGSKVYTNEESRAMSGSTFNMYGNVNLGSAGAVDRFFERLNAQKEMASLGVGV